MSEKRHVIEVSHVNKNFRDNKVLKDVSLRCESGKIYGLVGHNGSGKTVLFKIICGFLSCDEGTVSVDGKIMGKDKDMLTEAGIIIEDPGFLRNWRRSCIPIRKRIVRAMQCAGEDARSFLTRT